MAKQKNQGKFWRDRSRVGGAGRKILALAMLAMVMVVPAPIAGLSSADASPNHVIRFVYFVEQGETYRADHVEAIERHAYALQEYWYEQFGGTFHLDNPVVTVIRGDRDKNWYDRTGQSDRWNRISNIEREVRQKSPGSTVKYVMYPAGIIQGRAGANQSGAWMDGDDITCITGEGQSFPYPDGSPAKCLGHVAHELGHTYGLDHRGADEDCMQYGFYEGYGRGMCNFGESNRAQVRNNSRNDPWLSARPGDQRTGGRSSSGGGGGQEAPDRNPNPNPGIGSGGGRAGWGCSR